MARENGREKTGTGPVSLPHTSAEAPAVNAAPGKRPFALTLFGILNILVGTLLTVLMPVDLFSSEGFRGMFPESVLVLLAAVLLSMGLYFFVAHWRAAKDGTSLLPPARADEESSTPRLSRKAIVGAAWAPLVAVPVLFISLFWRVSGASNAPLFLLGPLEIFLGLPFLIPGFAAPLGTTILGLLALHDIRHSRGRIVGLPLALADALLFPLLLLDGLIAAVVAVLAPNLVRLVHQMTAPTPDSPIPAWLNAAMLLSYVLALLVIAAVDVFIVRAAWRTAKKPVRGAAEPPPAS